MRPRRKERPQRLALDELRGDEARAVDLPRVVHRDDVGVIERRDAARLAVESFDELLCGKALRGEHLQRELAPEPGVLGEEYLSHPAGSEWRDDAVVSQDVAWRKGPVQLHLRYVANHRTDAILLWNVQPGGVERGLMAGCLVAMSAPRKVDVLFNVTAPARSAMTTAVRLKQT